MTDESEKFPPVIISSISVLTFSLDFVLNENLRVSKKHNTKPPSKIREAVVKIFTELSASEVGCNSLHMKYMKKITKADAAKHFIYDFKPHLR